MLKYLLLSILTMLSKVFVVAYLDNVVVLLLLLVGPHVGRDDQRKQPWHDVVQEGGDGQEGAGEAEEGGVVVPGTGGTGIATP